MQAPSREVSYTCLTMNKEEDNLELQKARREAALHLANEGKVERGSMIQIRDGSTYLLKTRNDVEDDLTEALHSDSPFYFIIKRLPLSVLRRLGL